MNRSNSLIRCGFPFFTRKFGNTEIHDFDCTVGKHHYILRLYIPMDNSSFMSMLKRPQNLRNKMYSVLPAQNFSFSIYSFSVIPSIYSITINCIFSENPTSYILTMFGCDSTAIAFDSFLNLLRNSSLSANSF